MIEFRVFDKNKDVYISYYTPDIVLQYRHLLHRYDFFINANVLTDEWSEWKDIPTTAE